MSCVSVCVAAQYHLTEWDALTPTHVEMAPTRVGIDIIDKIKKWNGIQPHGKKIILIINHYCGILSQRLFYGLRHANRKGKTPRFSQQDYSAALIRIPLSLLYCPWATGKDRSCPCCRKPTSTTPAW